MKGRDVRPPGRVFLGLVEVAGFYAALRDALISIGVDATLVTVQEHPFAYGGAADGLLLRAKRRMAGRLAATHRPPARLALRLVNRGLDAVLLCWAVARFDTFVFGFGTSFTGRPGVEYRLLRGMGKRVVCMFHGSDSRPTYLDGALMAPGSGHTVEDCMQMTVAIKKLVATIDRHADVVLDNPLSAHFHEKPCVSVLTIGLPWKPPRTPDFRVSESGRRTVRILHSPSHPEAKGTARIREAVRVLREERALPLELVEVSGRPNAEVLEEIARCDFVVDQLYSDTPMATFAMEAAWFGKPAVVGGYGAAEFGLHIPPRARAPTEYCHPDELEGAIERLATDPAYRARLGARAEEFVRRRWSPGRVARRFVRVMQGRIPAGWCFDPRDVRHLRGACLPEERARALVAAVVERGGAAALQLADKPELEAQLLAFAEMD